MAGSGVDLLTALAFTNVAEAIGFVRAANEHSMPSVVSFTVETDGRLPSGMTLAVAIETVDAETDGAASYFMINCAHLDHFARCSPSPPKGRTIPLPPEWSCRGRAKRDALLRLPTSLSITERERNQKHLRPSCRSRPLSVIPPSAQWVGGTHTGR